MKSYFIALALPVLSLLSACSHSNVKFDDKTYEKNKESLAEKEKKNVVAFLEISGNDRRNWLGQTVIKGNIYNKASIVSYKDIRVKMLFYKKGQLVANHEDVYKDVLAPGNSMKFKARYGTPRGTDSVALSVMSAAIVDETPTKK